MTSATSRLDPPAPHTGRNAAIVGSVLLCHAAVLWAVQRGLARSVPPPPPIQVEMISQILAAQPPAPPPPPPPAPKPPPPPPPPKPQPIRRKAPPPPAPRPVAIRDTTPSPSAPSGVVDPPPPAPPAPPAPPEPPAPAPPAPPAPPPPAPAAPRLVEVTQGQVQYIREPRVVYPAISKRLGETGTVVLAVYFSAEGVPKRALIDKSSGFDRLDRAAQEALMQARITPIHRPGTNAATEFLFRAPIRFNLE